MNRFIKKVAKKAAESTIKRYDIINYLLNRKEEETCYLEIGVRNPEDCFNKIHCATKIGVDPNEKAQATYTITSDDFFEKVRTGALLHPDIKFDVIFIDGLHLADQVDRDIENALSFLQDDGFIVLHDCNPPSEWHARETEALQIPSCINDWNGTVWKAFLKHRCNPAVTSCCIDTDWGVGILTKKNIFSRLPENTNTFFEYSVFSRQREHVLNLLSFEQMQTIVQQKT
jgi:SAM-dependent methyltransferase